MISRCILLIATATALAGCCVSGNGCYAPLPGTPVAWDGLGRAPNEAAPTAEDRPRKNTRSRKEIIIGPIGDVAAEPNSKLQGKEALAQQEEADRADEERLTKKLMICRGCQPVLPREDATDHSAR
jgi:hypothetical protein